MSKVIGQGWRSPDFVVLYSGLRRSQTVPYPAVFSSPELAKASCLPPMDVECCPVHF